MEKNMLFSRVNGKCQVKQFRMNKIFLLLVILGSSTLSYAQQKGFVYDDINENGIFDKKEPHITKVIVTDGYDL
jgi:hypothetical protein